MTALFTRAQIDYMKIKKIPYYLSIALLACGASLILGLLSFTGMIALYPVLGFAVTAFVLSVAYEGEIYFQNIKGALTKLFKTNYLEQRLAKFYLLEHFPENLKDSPPFFKEYNAQLKRVAEFSHKNLDDLSLKRKKHEEKILSDMEKWFALELFQGKDRQDSELAESLRPWLAKNGQDDWLAKLNSRRTGSYFIQLVSVIAGLFIGFGTTYLLVEAFGAVAFLAAVPAMWPAIIIPLAIVAGLAYGMLVYNAITDFITNETVKKWWNKFVSDWRTEGLSFRNVVMVITTVALIALAATLTVFTAGTWWTVADKAVPLFDWMKKVPTIVIGVIEGLSSLFFNLLNTSETLKLFDEFLGRLSQRTKDFVIHVREKGFLHAAVKPVYETVLGVLPNENWAQKLNPARLIIKITIMPLRMILFFGHLISIAFTGDRMPGVPEKASFMLTLISEGFEDAHYFIGHDHDHASTSAEAHHHHSHGAKKSMDGHLEAKPCHKHATKELLEERLGAGPGHNHDTDIPTMLLKSVAILLYVAAALWDWGFSQFNKNHPKAEVIETFSEAFAKQWGNIKESVTLTEPSPLSFQCQQALMSYKLGQLENKQERAWSADLAGQKREQLRAIKDKVNHCVDSQGLAKTLAEAKENGILNQHRLFAVEGEKTKTQESIEALEQRVCIH